MSASGTVITGSILEMDCRNLRKISIIKTTPKTRSKVEEEGGEGKLGNGLRFQYFKWKGWKEEDLKRETFK